MNVLIVKNVLTEGPGTIADFLRDERILSRVVELHGGAELPSMDGFTHVVVLGGPMAVYEMDRYPYLVREARLIEDAIGAGKRVLGVCLGAQMIAHALGARVYAGGAKEIGWYEVGITDEGMRDPCMRELAVHGRNAAHVFQWHGDTFDLPGGCVRLASSDLFPNQAFSYAGRVYALQFHIEVTPEIVQGWLAHEPGIDLAAVNAESVRLFDAYLARAKSAYRMFFLP